LDGLAAPSLQAWCLNWHQMWTLVQQLGLVPQQQQQQV
jgi:hypothetical protein